MLKNERPFLKLVASVRPDGTQFQVKDSQFLKFNRISHIEWEIRDLLLGNDHYEIDINEALTEQSRANQQFEKQGWKLAKHQKVNRMYLTENQFRTVNTLTLSTKELFDALPEVGFFTLSNMANLRELNFSLIHNSMTNDMFLPDAPENRTAHYRAFFGNLPSSLS